MVGGHAVAGRTVFGQYGLMRRRENAVAYLMAAGFMGENRYSKGMASVCLRDNVRLSIQTNAPEA